MSKTSLVGETSEAKVLARFLELGFVVLIPWGVKRFDFVIDRGQGFERVQVKTGRLKNGAISANLFSVHPRTGEKTKYTKEQIELFAIYCPENDSTYLLPVEIVARDCTLRVEPAKNNQTQNVRLAENFKI